MKISLRWLSEWVDVGNDVYALSHALTMAGLEIEGIASVAPPISGVVIGEVLSVEKHPEADKLSVCRVSKGSETLQVVCGAKNVRPGLKVPFAQIGAQLPNGLEIKKAKLRGIESLGMLCSAKELGLADDSAGLMELPAELQTGEDFVVALALDDRVLEVNLTPNRGDCMSVLGIARELAAIRSATLRGPELKAIPAVSSETFPVRIESVGCGKFASRVIRGVRGGAAAPLWLRERLRRAGLRSVNAIVDITNYVMLELGQPMHAYDLAKLHKGIVVRQALAAENLKLLDGRTVELTPDVLVIADDQSALGMAGVMGGSDSAISNETQDVLLEVAFFEPDAIAGRGRRYGLVTDASQRFERGVDPEQQERALERATQLLLASAGGTPGPAVITRSATLTKHIRDIRLRHARLNHLLGHDVSKSEVPRILRALGMQLSAVGESEWQVTPPSWRFDLAIEEDLVEEVARLYGYDHINSVDAVIDQAIQSATEYSVTAERAALLLVDRGYQEAINYSFTDPSIQQILFPGETAIALANPLSAELSVMRLSLWPGLVKALRDNQNRQQPHVRLFEIGRTFSTQGSKETDVIAGLAGGLVAPKQWGSAANRIDFFDVKNDVESLLQLSGEGEQFRFVGAPHSALHPGQSARIWRGDTPVGWIGTLNPMAVRQLDLNYTAVVFELDVAAALRARLPVYQEISKFPAIRRDVALVVAENLSFADLRSEVQQSAGGLLKDVTVFDIYRGDEIGKGKKSIALGLNLQDTSRTLTDDDADRVLSKVVEHLRQRFDAHIRDR
jgi:phenylalanyl-tRNA synthetase beta chain